jgi:hypothetical protein
MEEVVIIEVAIIKKNFLSLSFYCCLYDDILFFIYKRTVFKYSEIEDEYFRRKVEVFEYVLKNRKEKGAK